MAAVFGLMAAMAIMLPWADSTAVAAPAPAAAPVEVEPICWAVTDDTPEILRFNLSPTNPIPPTALPLSQVYSGEGMAYRASRHDLVMFSDAPAQMWQYDVDTGTETQVGAILPGHVDAAALWVDPAHPTDERLWIVIGALLYRIDPDTAEVLDGPHILPGIGGSSGGLAFEPHTGELWMTDDSPESVLYTVSLTDFTITKVADIHWPDGARPDAESLDFGAQGQLYTEEDFGGHKGSRYILQIDMATGLVTPVAGPTPGLGDLEGLGCNGGAEVFRPANPAIDIEKYVNTFDADEAPGPDVEVGSTVHFKYVVTNTGSLPLRDISLTDDRGVTVVCPSGDATIGALAVGEIVECNGTSTGLPELYRNVGAVSGWADPVAVSPGARIASAGVAGRPNSPMASIEVTDSDPANYRGFVDPPPTESTPASTVPPVDPVPSYDDPERFISHDSRPPVTDLLDITLPETGNGPRTGSALGAAIGLLSAGGILLWMAHPRRRRPCHR